MTVALTFLIGVATGVLIAWGVRNFRKAIDALDAAERDHF